MFGLIAGDGRRENERNLTENLLRDTFAWVRYARIMSFHDRGDSLFVEYSSII